MSISYKKINSMINLVVGEADGLDDIKKEVLRELCQKIYMKESAVDHSSKQQMINDIKGEISLKADKY